MRYLLCFFFFKQKTADEMRISDWSSDVCSSDLSAARPPHVTQPIPLHHALAARLPPQARPPSKPPPRNAAEHPSGQCQQAASRLLATRRCSVFHQHGRACRLPPDRPATPAPFACTAIARLPDDAWQSHDTTPDNVRTPKRWYDPPLRLAAIAGLRQF